jgi:phytoene dehydrogenase-like protein
MAGHSLLALDKAASNAFALVLGMAGHAVGWPIPRGGSQSITNALISYLESLGGEVHINSRIASLRELPKAKVILCDIGPRQLLALAGDQLPRAFQQRLERYRYGPAAFKLDWALDRPIPWKNPDVARAATVHLAATFEEILESERAAWQNRTVEYPLVLLAQPSLFDPTRAPERKHTGWAYCHVPNGSAEDMTDRIERQVERFAPGFRQSILARHVFTPTEFQRYNENLVGGDINGGAQDLPQMFLRPTRMLYSTPLKNVFICSSSSPPGGGVHGMCGFHAAKAALAHLR